MSRDNTWIEFRQLSNIPVPKKKQVEMYKCVCIGNILKEVTLQLGVTALSS